LNKLATVREAQFERLFADLNGKHAIKADAAAEGIRLMGRDAEPMLARLHGPGTDLNDPKFSTEGRRVTSAALDRLREDNSFEPSISAPAVLRGLAVLEAIGNDEARRALKELATGPSGSRIANEAQAALSRLEKRTGMKKDGGAR
jgi:hypothetical protein